MVVVWFEHSPVLMEIWLLSSHMGNSQSVFIPSTVPMYFQNQTRLEMSRRSSLVICRIGDIMNRVQQRKEFMVLSLCFFNG